MTSVIFTHVRNVDMNILLQLDDELLQSVCRIDKYTQSLCNDNTLWHLKLNKAYPGLPIPKGYQQKLKDLYQILTTEASVTNWAAEKGHLEVLKWLAQTKNIYPDQDGANDAAMSGQLEVLKWLAGHNIYPDQKGANFAAKYGHLEVLKWLAGHNIYPNKHGANYAAYYGHLEVLKWLAETKNLYPNQRGANDAAMSGQLEVLKWLANHGIYPN